jgi:2-polyprenyl-3-methyl-5-hydroxy-6-metoxy-1,4-benzoquinol methylase
MATSHLGVLPDVAVFAGVQLDHSLKGGFLHLCHNCRFVFRAPILTDDEYLSLYAQGSSEIWEPREAREDFRLIRKLVPNGPVDVLDIGCYTGSLLATLPKSCRLYGVEPNPSAAAVAAARGVNVVAQDWKELDAADHAYDIIIACDVIEHLGNPLSFLTTLSTQLRPGGKLIISTGNADAWLWTLVRSRFWYCYFPEHISFISPRWLASVAPSASLSIRHLESFAHSQLPNPVSRAKALLKTCLRALAESSLRSAGQRQLEQVTPLGGGVSKDHMLCVLSHQ